jgi:hypothetical protein
MHTRMKGFALGVAGAIVAGALGAGEARAQEPAPRTTVGYGVGMFTFSPFVEAATGDARFESSLGGSLYLHHWLNPWFGLQLDAAYTRPELTLGNQLASVDTWAFSGGLTVRPLGPPRPVAPYAMGAAGLISYGLGGPSLRLGETELILDTDETEQFMLQVGGGLDIALLTTLDQNVVSLRVEAANLMVSGRPFRMEGQGAGQAGGHSHLRLTVGLNASIPRF